jgi:hypothetical protein
MDNFMQSLINALNNKFIAYMPEFLSGIAFIVFGLFLGWLVKRILIQISMILRVERYLTGFQWGKGFLKADLRHGLYNLIGTSGFFIIFLMFVYRAVTLWRLPILSKLLEQGILFLPRLITSMIVFVLGWGIASVSAKSIQKGLLREDIPRANLIARFVKTVLIIFFSSIALTELDISREIVLIGFSTIFITLSAIAILFVVMGGKDFLKKVLKFTEDEE